MFFLIITKATRKTQYLVVCTELYVHELNLMPFERNKTIFSFWRNKMQVSDNNSRILLRKREK